MIAASGSLTGRLIRRERYPVEAIKILIVDDHTVVRDGLVTMLSRQSDFVVTGEAVNGLEAVEKARELQPDVILMDLRRK